MADVEGASKPDLKSGVSLEGLADNAMIAGHVDDDDVILARRGDEFFAVGAYCTHYHAPLADGLIAGDGRRIQRMGQPVLIEPDQLLQQIGERLALFGGGVCKMEPDVVVLLIFAADLTEVIDLLN